MATPDMNAEAAGTVAARIRTCRNKLDRAELAVADVLNSGYPTEGRAPIVQLAAAAGVSAPTVLQMIAKPCFDGYPASQTALRA